MSNPKPFQDAQRGKERLCSQGSNLNSTPIPMQHLLSIANSAFLRLAGERTPETLQEAPGQALLTITAHDAAFRGLLIVGIAQTHIRLPKGKDLVSEKASPFTSKGDVVVCLRTHKPV